MSTVFPRITIDTPTTTADAPGLVSAPVSMPRAIPQSAANPLAAEMIDQEAQRIERANRRKRWSGLMEEAALAPDAFFQKYPPPMIPGDDIEARKKRLVNRTFVRAAIGGGQLPADPTAFEVLRNRVADRLFEGRGKDSDEAFHGEVVRHATAGRDRREVFNSISDEASRLAITGIVSGESASKAWATAREKVAAMPGFKAGDEADHHWEFSRNLTARRAALAPFADDLWMVWKTFQAKGDTRSVAFSVYDKLTDRKDQQAFMGGLRALAKSLPEAEQKDWWLNLKRTTGEAVGDMASDAASSIQANASTLNLGYVASLPGGTITQGMGDVERQRAAVAADSAQRKRLDFVADVQRIERQDYDPIDYYNEDGTWARVAENVLYSAPGAIATTAFAAVPGIGLPAYFASATESTYQDYRMRFEDSGMSYDEASRAAGLMAPVSGALEVALEKLQISAFGGKSPLGEKVVRAVNDRVSGALGQLAIRSGVNALEEGMLEQFQGMLPDTIQWAAGQMGMNVPAMEWRNGKNGILDGFWKDSVQNIATMLPLSIILGGRGVIKDRRRIGAADRAADLQFKALGASEADIAAYRSQTTFAGKLDALNGMMERRDPKGEPARLAAAEIKKLVAAAETAATEMQRAGLMPRVTVTKDGFSVADPQTGDVVGTATDRAGAMRIASQHFETLKDETSARVAYMASMLDAAAETVAADPESKMVVDPSTRMDISKAIEEGFGTLERYQEQVRLEEIANGGNGDMSRIILGMNRVEQASGMRQTVSRIWEGGTVATQIHEFGHGKRREAREKGVVSRADEIAFLRAMDAVWGNRKTKQGEALRFIPDGVADADVTEEMLDEGFSKVLEMEIMRRRPGGSKRNTGTARADLAISGGVVTANMRAIGRIVGEKSANKWRAFFDGIRAYFGLATARALALKKAAREGKFDEGAHEAYLSKMLGLSEVDELAGMVRDEHAAIIGAAEAFQASEDMPFSLGNRQAAMNLSHVPTNEPGGANIGDGSLPGNSAPQQSGAMSLAPASMADPPPTTQESHPLVEAALIGADSTADSGTRPVSNASSLAFQSAPDRSGDLSPRGDAQGSPSFAISRQQQKYEKAKKNMEDAAARLHDEEQKLAQERQKWESEHGKTVIAPENGYFIEWIPYNEPVPVNDYTWFITRHQEPWGVIRGRANSTRPLHEKSVAVSFGYEFAQNYGHRITTADGRILREVPGYDHLPFPDPPALIAARESLMEAEAALYLAAEDYNPDQPDHAAAGESARQWKLSRQAAAFAALLDARDAKARDAAKSFVAKLWLSYARHDEIFQYGRTSSKKAADIAAAVSTLDKPITAADFGTSVLFSSGRGQLTINDADTPRPYISASSASSKGKKQGGGSQLYAAALDWIHNNGKRIKDDPAGLTAINHIRRTSNFAASAIRWGTTSHLKPHSAQKVGKWTRDDILNISLLLTREMDNAFKAIPQAKEWTFDFRSGIFTEADGQPLTDEEIETAVASGDPDNSGIGFSTLQRAIITRSAIEAFHRGETLDSLETALSNAPDSITGISYSLAPASVADALKQRDAEYLAAVERGDTETAQRMVDEAAKRAGYDAARGFHGSGERFDRFSLEYGGKVTEAESAKIAFFFTDGLTTARSYAEKAAVFSEDKEIAIILKKIERAEKVGNWDLAEELMVKAEQLEFGEGAAERRAKLEKENAIVYDVYLKGKFLTLNASGNSYLTLSEAKDFKPFKGKLTRALEHAKEQGFDGVEVLNFDDAINQSELATHWAVFDPTQIKSADPVTRDDQGNVIPLSQRFNPADDRISYSLAPASMADALAIRAAQVTDPRAKSAMFRAMADKLGALVRLRDEFAVVAGKIVLLRAVPDPRTTASLKKEAAFREADLRARYEDEVSAKWQGLLEDGDLVKLKEQPVHAHLADPASPLRGRLMSAKQAIARGLDFFDPKKHGDYDGADGVSRSVFGGRLMPDQAAQELFDAGLIKHPTPDAMWDALKREAASVGRMKEHAAKAKAELADARARAKQEAAAWRKTAAKEQAAAYSPRKRLLRAMAMLDAILSSVPAEVRGRVGGYTPLARLGSDEAMLDFLQDRLGKTEAAVEKYLVREYGKMFVRLLEREKVKKNVAGKRPKGKAGADVHAIFANVRRATAWSGAEAEAHVAKLEAELNDANNPPTAEREAALLQEIGIIPLVADWKNANSASRAAAFESANRILTEGMAEFAAKKLRERERRAAVRETLQKETGKTGTAAERDAAMLARDGFKTGWKKYLFGFGSFETVMHRIFGEDSADAQRMADMQQEADFRKTDEVQGESDAFEDMLATLTNGDKLEAARLQWRLSRKDKRIGGRTMSEMEMITATLMWRQEDGRRHMEGHKDENGNFTGRWHYGQDFVDACEASLSNEAKAVRSYLTEKYAAEWDTLNPIFRSLYGIDLPRHANYSPLSVQPVFSSGADMADPVTGQAVNGTSGTPPSLRTRAQGAIAEPNFKDAAALYMAHVKQLAHWKAYAALQAEFSALVGHRDVRNAIEAAGGKDAVGVVAKWQQYFTAGGFTDAAATLALFEGIGSMQNRAAGIALVGRIGVLAIQATQLGASLAEIPTKAFAVRFGKLMTGQLGWGAAFRSSYIQRRLKQMPPVVQMAMEGLAAAKPNRIKHEVAKLGRLISGADALFTAGTYAIIYDYQLTQARKNGASEAEAVEIATKAAERSTDRVAQPTRAGARSIMELTTQANPYGRLVFAFASESRQKLAYALFTSANPQASAARKMRAIAATWLISGCVATLIRTIWRDMREDDDEEWFDSRNWAWERLMLQAITGPLQGVPVIGDLIEAGAFKATGQFMPEGNMLSTVPRAVGSIMNIPDYFKGERDFESALKDAEATLSGLGVFSETIAAAASLSHLVRDLYGLADNAID